MQALARYWSSEYDWRRCEARLNALSQFTTEIDGVVIHFLHVRSPHPDALPLIMTHGWPGSVVELLEVVGPLTDPTAHGGPSEDAFDLVLPSLPGYGFSGEPAEVGWDAGRIAQAWAELMRRLGYTRYVAQGGDQGAAVTDAMGRQAPEGLLGIHVNLLRAALGGGGQPAETEQERAAQAAVNTFRTNGFGYFLEQATRPQTIGTPCSTHPPPWPRGCSTMTPTATTRSPAPSSTGSPRAISPGTTSSTTSPCTG
jgi:pimeloyl-ACP methyl ester carboxylesterase